MKVVLNETSAMTHITWYVTAQLKNKATVTLTDSSGSTFDSRTSQWPVPSDISLIQKSYPKSAGKDLILDITVLDNLGRAVTLKSVERRQVITNNVNEPVGFVYMCAIEDEGDNDYNDVTVYIAAWK